ncbi:MAG TPA: multicopper oxidase family protein [Candidatus Limnocylindrales bacterium]|nr:multicopper oxidase family protein [Candidatus Limnocylindrales bacterium]
MINRRNLLLGGLAAGMLGACTRGEQPPLVAIDGPEVQAAEAARNPGPVVDARIEAKVIDVDMGGTTVRAWSYDGRIPGTPIRVNAGDQLKVTLANRLPAGTSIHWHGIALRNDADGVPHVTQKPIAVGTDYTYQFTAAHPGTYWLHPHAGTQLDRGLYAPLIVEDPHEPLSYDNEWVVVLDDWLDRNPDDVLAKLRKTMMHGGMTQPMATSVLLGGDAGDVAYPYFLLNGRPQADPEVFEAKPGQRVRIRFINAGADTVFRVAIGGHRMSVTHTDGYPVVPVDTDALLIAMGERYDVVVTLAAGVFPVVALAEGKKASAFALIRTAGGQAPPASVLPAELERHIVAYRRLKPAEGVALPAKQPERTIGLELTGGMMGYDWGFNGKRFDHTRAAKDAYEVNAGERVRLDLVNTTTMFHPIHLHGHTFATGEASGPRKDTAIVLPGQTLPVFFDADNPGQWMIHCHNVYHAESGMMVMLGYRRKG